MSKTRMGKRVASLLLSLVMMLSLLPTTVYAEGADTGDTTDEIVGQATTSGDNTVGGTTSNPEPTGEDEGGGTANVSEGEDGAATNDAVVEETIAPVNAEGVDAVANAESTGDEVSGEDGSEAGNKAETYVAQVGDTKYATLKDAIAAAEAGQTVTLLANVKLTSTQAIRKQLTIDLNGKTISSTAYRTIRLNAGADLTVKDSASGGKITNTYTGSAYPSTIYLIDAGAKFTLESGTIESDPNVTSLQSVAINSEKNRACEVNIKGGSVTVPEDATNGRAIVASTNSMTLNISGGTITGGLHGVDAYSGSNVTITGGKITARVVDTGVIKEAYGMRLKGTANVTVAGGEITGVKMDDNGYKGDVPIVKLKSGTIKGSFYSISTGTIIFDVAENADIVLENDSAEQFLPDTVKLVEKENGTYGVKKTTYVAEVNGTQYETLQEAIKAASTGNTITLLDDVDLGSSKIGFYKTGCENLTFDLNGHKITSAIQNNGTVVASRVGLVIKNGTIENTCMDTNAKKATSAVYVTSGGTTTLENVTLHSNYSGLYVCQLSNAVTVVVNVEKDTVINGGMYGVNLDAPKGTATTAPGVTLNVNGGTITGTEYGIHANSPSSGKYGTINANITAGTVDGVGVVSNNTKRPVKLDITGGTINGELYNSGSTVTISGGTFTTKPNETYLAGGYVFAANADGTYGVVEAATAVAQVGDKEYATLQEAIDKASKNATVKLLADTKENVTIDKALTLDLNGFTLNGSTGERKPALMITARIVTIKDSSEKQTGTIMREDTAENSGVSSHYVIDIQGAGWLTFEGGNVKNGSGAGGTKGASLVRVGGDSVKKQPGLVINGGTFTQDNFIVIKVDRGYLTLNGGTLNSASTYAVENWFVATIKGGTVNGAVSSWTYSDGSNSTLTIEGGTVTGDVTSVNYGNAEGKKATVAITGGTINVKLDTRSYDPKTGELTSIVDAAKATIKVSGGTFNNAVETRYCDEGYTPVPNSDGTFGVKQQEQQVLAKVGDTLYYTMDDAFQAVKKDETITLLRDYTTGAEQYSGSKSFAIDLGGHTWTYTGTNTNHAAFEINHSDVTLTVKNGTVVSNSMVGLIPSVIDVDGPIAYDNAGLVFEGVTMTANGHSGIETNGNNTNDTVTLKNSTLNVPNGFGIYFPSSGKLTIDNSTINAKTMGVQVCAGSLSISGDQTAITVSGDAVHKTENDGAIQDGAAISVVNRTGYKGLGDVTVTGGKFTAKTGNEAIKAYNWKDNTESAFSEETKVAVSGGSFSSAVPEGLCKAGYIPTVNADSTHGVKKGTYVAKVDNVKYESLQAAINAAKGGSTVRLLANVTLTETAVFPAGKKVDLNLVGHNITATGTALRINGKTDIQSTGGVGTIESTGNVAVAVGNDASLTVYSGTLMGREGAVITGTSTGAKIEIRKNATLIATDNAVIAGNGRQRDGKPNTILVKGGTFIGGIKTTGYIACGIYAPWNDNVTVSGGTFNITNGAGIVARAGTVEVTGGTFNCGDGTAKGWVGDSKNNVPNAALVFDEAANYPALTTDSEILVSGGSFSTDPAANGATLADGFEPKQGKDGMYTLVASDPVAAVNGVSYATLGKAITAAQATAGGATITLLKDIKTSSYYTVNGDNPVTINLAGYNITGSGISGLFYVTAKGDLTIKGEGTVTAVEDNGAAMAVWVRSPIAKVTLEGGTYTQQITNTADPHFDLIYVERGNVYVKGGTYKGFTPDWTLNCKDEHYQSKEANIEVTGGTFYGFDPSNNKAEGENTNFVPAGYVSTKGADGNFVVTEVKVAEVNGVAYATLSEAIAAANAGDTVTLIANFSTDATKTTATDRLIVDKSITLDLNGYTMTIPGELESSLNWAAFYINGGTLTVKDSTKSTGAIIGADKTEENPTYRGGVYLFHLNSGNLVIENGTFYAGGTVVNVETGTATVNGGKFSVYPDVDTKDSRYLLNCIDKNYGDGTAKIIVNGGTFTNFDPRNNKAEGEGTDFVAPGVGVNADADGNFVAKANMLVQLVDAEGNSVAAYDTLWEAFANAKDLQNTTLIVLQDITDSNPVYIDATNTTGSITLDLNDYNISFIENEWSGEHSGFNIQNATALDFIITGKGTITAAASNIAAIRVQSSSLSTKTTLTIEKDVTAIGHTGVMVDKYQTVAPGGNGITVNIAGTVKSVNNGIGVYVNGSITEQQPVINVMSTARIEADSWGMYLAGNNKTTVASGAQISGTGTGIEIRAGELTLNDCTVTGGSGELWANANGSGTTVGNAAVAVSQHNTNLPITVTVNGGTYTGTAAFYQFDGRTDTTGTSGEVKTSITRGTFLGQVAAETGVLVITGGSFSTNVTAYCAIDYQCNKPTEDEPLYTVTKKDANEIDVKRSLTLDNSLTMNYKVKLPTGYTSARVEFKFYNDYTKAFETATVTGVLNESTGRYEFAFTGINPQRMTDTLKATVYATNVDTKEETAFPVDDFSAAQYCNVLLASDYNKDGAYNELVGNLVAYGTAAQLYQKYHTDKLVSSVVTGGTVVQYPLTDVVEVNELTAVTGGVSIEKKSLVLSNAFAIRVKFALEGDTTINQVTFKVKADATTATISQFEKETLSDGTVYYYFDFAGLNSKQLGSTVTFTAVVDGNDNDVLAFSANTYLKLMSNVTGVSTELKNLLAALYNYGYTCGNFKA